MMAYLPASRWSRLLFSLFYRDARLRKLHRESETPSHNIFCLYETYEGLVAGQPPDLRCELAQISSVPPPPPRPCPFSWGLGFRSYSKERRGRENMHL